MNDLAINLNEEKAFVEKARSDPQAFGRLYDRNYSKIFGYVLKRTVSIDLAQDITSEVFFKALKHLGKFKWTGVPFSAWLYRIASNEIANHFKQQSRNQVLMEEAAAVSSQTSPSPEVEISRAEQELQKHREFIALHEEISRLPEKYQEVIVLRFFEKKSIDEIGDILGKKEGTVKSLLHRGLEKLRFLTRQNATFSQQYCLPDRG